ncbi:MAG: hypothetical protein JWP65_782 [Ramlibacter sp.]|jgi:hypothetical protein|uniref:hypothetical protein n=1 Tax=Ramlibacter sp. TaxID=1917967 RepID=UPI0026191788|nr:hypothetical protein [Ramlibacter sp.]MDB5750361.1 hypothetical protein [Ramlibacter sp.]
MSGDASKKPARDATPAPVPVPGPNGSGKGADTALEALIRQRKLGHAPEEQRGPPDPQPARS